MCLFLVSFFDIKMAQFVEIHPKEAMNMLNYHGCWWHHKDAGHK